jgi:hypothetical protein
MAGEEQRLYTSMENIKVSRVSTGLENPGKSLNWKKNSRTGKSLKISRRP